MGSKLADVFNNIKNVNPIIVKTVLATLSQVEDRTNAEIEKVVSAAVDKLLKDKSIDAVSEDIKAEIVHKFSNHNKGKNLIPILKYVNKVLLTNAPKSVTSAKNFKRNIANTLIKDAKKRLEKNHKN